MFISRSKLEGLEKRIAKLEADAYVRVRNGDQLEGSMFGASHTPRYEKVTISEVMRLLGAEIEWGKAEGPRLVKPKRK